MTRYSLVELTKVDGEFPKEKRVTRLVKLELLGDTNEDFTLIIIYRNETNEDFH